MTRSPLSGLDGFVLAIIASIPVGIGLYVLVTWAAPYLGLDPRLIFMGLGATYVVWKSTEQHP